MICANEESPLFPSVSLVKRFMNIQSDSCVLRDDEFRIIKSSFVIIFTPIKVKLYNLMTAIQTLFKTISYLRQLTQSIPNQYYYKIFSVISVRELSYLCYSSGSIAIANRIIQESFCERLSKRPGTKSELIQLKFMPDYQVVLIFNNIPRSRNT